MLKAVIVEDEHHSADTLRIILEEYCPDVQVTNVYRTLKEGRKGLNLEKPDLLFLDIMLSDGSGFDLLDLPDLKYKVIFTTAFDHYALKAIRFSALDYLLKPLNIREVCDAVAKAREFSRNTDEKERVNMLVKNLRGEKLKHIALPTQTGFNFVEVASIVRIEADGAYSNIFFTKGEPVLVSHNLKYFENLLEGNSFFRVHHSHLVNLSMVIRYHNGKGGYLSLQDGSSVEVSKRRKTDMIRVLGIRG